jgi:hypothetical protein
MKQTSFERTGKEDDYINGYEGGGGFRYDFNEKIDESLLTVNSEEGYAERTKAAARWVGNDPKKSGIVGNECGWILEYWFGKAIAPKYYSTTFYPSPTRYETSDEFYAPWDFVMPGVSIEIKTQNQGSNTERLFMCPQSKFTKDYPNTFDFDVWWCEISSYDDIIKNRYSCPKNWRVFNCNKTRWDSFFIDTKYYTNTNYPAYYEKVFRPTESMRNDGMIDSLVATIRPPTFGTKTGDQLYFETNKLEEITINGVPDENIEEEVEEEEEEEVKKELPNEIVLTDRQTEDYDLLEPEEQEEYIDDRKNNIGHSDALYNLFGREKLKILDKRSRAKNQR